MVAGKYMYIPDMLTRMNSSDSDDADKQEEIYINSIEILANEIEKDLSLECSNIIKIKNSGSKSKKIDKSSKNTIDDFKINDNGVLYYLPRVLRSKILKLFHDDPLHGAHLAKEKTQGCE